MVAQDEQDRRSLALERERAAHPAAKKSEFQERLDQRSELVKQGVPVQKAAALTQQTTR